MYPIRWTLEKGHLIGSSFVYNEKTTIGADEYEQGKLPSQIFEEVGVDAEVLGTTRIWKTSNRWRAAYKDNGVAGLEDTRKYSSGRPLERELSIEEKYARLEAKMK